jgi:methionine sulfoxide reductase heme-binding subunit
MAQRDSAVSVPPIMPVGKEVDRGVWRTLRRDLWRATLDAAVAVLLSGIVFAILVARVRAGSDPAALEMPDMVQNGGVWPYSLSQAFGWAALLWSWLTVLLGLSLPILVWRRHPQIREIAERLHRSTSLTVVGLVITHAILLIWDKMGDTLITVFIPWTTSYKPGLFPEALGIVSFYLALLLGPSFYLRDKLGPRTWRLLHRYFVPTIYILAVWHTFLYGSDLNVHNKLWIMLWVIQIPIVGAFSVRLFILLRR